MRTNININHLDVLHLTVNSVLREMAYNNWYKVLVNSSIGYLFMI